MDKNSIKNLLDNTFVNEAKVRGLDVTNKAKSESGKQNKKAIKDIEGKLSNYDKESKDMAKGSINPVKFNHEGKDEEEYHTQMEIMNGQEMIEYDRTVNKTFSDRAEEALAGSSRMGNNPEWANVVPKQQGFTGPDFGKNLVKNIKASEKKRKEQSSSHKFFGDFPYETKPYEKNYAMESKTKKETMKRLTFKKPFNGVHNALNLIPESYKIDNKVFELNDGNESYRVRWEGSLNEGKAVVLMAADKTLVNEDMQKMKHLMGYKSHETFGTLKGSERLNEDKKFGEIWNKTKSLLTENEDLDNDDMENTTSNDDAYSKTFDMFNEEDSTTTNQATIKKTALEVIKNDVPKMTPAEKESFDEIIVKLGELFSTGGNQDTGMFKTVKEKMLTMVDDITKKKGQQTPTNEDLSPEEEMPEAPSHEETDANQVYEMDRFEEVFAGMGDDEDMDGEQMEEGFLETIKKGIGKIGGIDSGLEKAIKTPVGKELYDSYMNSTNEKEWFNKNKGKLVSATKAGGAFDTPSGSSIQSKDFVEFLRKKKSQSSDV
jgi:hypothetical protein